LSFARRIFSALTSNGWSTTAAPSTVRIRHVICRIHFVLASVVYVLCRRAVLLVVLFFTLLRASRVQVWYDCANILEQFFTSRLEALPSVF
jgi:hypothetical protein